MAKIIFLILTCQSVYGQLIDFTSNDCHLEHYTDENGLPQNSVKKIAQDDAGFIWLGTETGLTRYDGDRFLNFGQLNSLQGIISMEPDTIQSAKSFFAITDHYNKIKVKNGKAYPIPEPNSINLLQSSFLSIHNIYNTRGLPDPSNGRIFPKQLKISFSDNQKFICMQNEILYIKNKKQRKHYTFINSNFWRFFRLNSKLYYFSLDNRLSIFNPKSNNSTVETTKIHRLPWSKDHKIYWNNSMNQVFIQVGDSLFWLYEGYRGRLEAIAILSNFNFRAIQIQSIFYEPHSKKLFLGSPTEGLYVIQRKAFRALTSSNTYHDNVYYAQALINDSTILTPQGTSFIFKSNKKVGYQSHSAIKKFYDADKYSMTVDKQENIWIKNFKYLNKFNKTGKTTLSRSQFKEHITQIYSGRNHRLWIGFKQSGLYYTDSRQNNINPIKFIGAPLSDITWIQQTNDSILWVGTDKGLFHVNLQNKETKKIRQLAEIYVRSLFNSKENELWITTYRDGIFLIKDDRFIKFPLDPKGYLARSHCIVEDQSGFMWVTTNNGIFQFKKSALLQYALDGTIPYHHYYNKGNGFNINEFNGGCQPCAIQMPNGYISFPSMDGLVWYNPDEFKSNPPQTPIVIDKVMVDNRKAVLHGDSLTLKPDYNVLEIDFSKAYFGDPVNQHVYYSISTSEKPTSTFNRLQDHDYNLSIPSLKPGHYLLTLRSINGFEKNNIIEKKIHLFIKTPWFQTWWFIAVVTLIIIGIIMLFFRLKLRSALRKNEILENKIKERTLTLQETVLDLKNSQSELLKQNNLHTHILASISHDFRSPLKLIHSWVYDIPEIIQINETKSLIVNSIIVEKTLTHMMHLTDNMTEYMKAISKGAKSGLETHNLAQLIETKTAIFQSIARIKKDTITIKVCSSLEVHTNSNLLGILIHNLVDNALKAKPNGEIMIRAKTVTLGETSGVRLIISDNGPGMPLELVQWLNSPVQEHAIPPKSYQGLGLAMIKSICELLNISLRVRVDRGTSFFMTLS